MRVLVGREPGAHVTGIHGLVRATVQNMITGVTQGFSRELEIQGTGFRAEVKGKKAKA